jgi:general stress protein 26
MVALTNDLRIIKELIDSQHLAVLSTVSGVRPFSYLVFFAATSNLEQMVFATERNSHKYRSIAANSNVSLQIDNREPVDGVEVAAITVLGQATDDAPKRLKQVLLSRHPALGAFLDKPDCALIRVKVEKYVIAHFAEAREVLLG